MRPLFGQVGCEWEQGVAMTAGAGDIVLKEENQHSLSSLWSACCVPGTVLLPDGEQGLLPEPLGLHGRQGSVPIALATSLQVCAAMCLLACPRGGSWSRARALPTCLQPLIRPSSVSFLLLRRAGWEP